MNELKCPNCGVNLRDAGITEYATVGYAIHEETKMVEITYIDPYEDAGIRCGNCGERLRNVDWGEYYFPYC